VIEVNKSEKGKRARAYIYRFLCVCLLDDTDGCVCEEDEKNYKGLGECAEKRTTFLSFYESENEGDNGRCEQDENELILELLED
jgi:hypothetical protein